MNIINNHKTLIKVAIVSMAFCLYSATAHAQRFWLTTYSFPGGPKTSLTITNDSCLFVGLTNAVMRSCDAGVTWSTVLNTQVVFSLFTSQSGRVFAGSNGKIYTTDDQGSTWDSVMLGHNYPVTKIIQNKNWNLFAITGDLDLNLGFVGAGVFFSSDNGSQWEPRNTGLTNYLSCEQIAHDSHGRLYLAVADEFVSGESGLFVSDNDGIHWQHIDINIDGKGVINNSIKIANTIGLSVSPDDVVYFSISGTAVNVAVTLNISKNSSNIQDTTYWHVNTVSNTSIWWNDRLLNSIYFASTGFWYSSRKGSVNIGGTFISTNKGKTWNQQLQGLGYDQSGQYNTQYFAENDTGKIYMVQLMDERVYWIDTMSITSIVENTIPDIQSMLVFPNPVSSGNEVYIRLADNTQNSILTITNILGETVFQSIGSNQYQFNAPETKGLYQVCIKQKGGNTYTNRLLVN